MPYYVAMLLTCGSLYLSHQGELSERLDPISTELCTSEEDAFRQILQIVLAPDSWLHYASEEEPNIFELLICECNSRVEALNDSPRLRQYDLGSVLQFHLLKLEPPL